MGNEVGRRALGALAATAAALVWSGSALAAPGPCDQVMPLADVAVGQIGEGWTVVSGTDPASFDVEVLGIATDAVAPGRDVIIVKISGPTVDAGGGVWAGMSGSPVYIDDGGGSGPRFAGALAYGLSFGATNIAGLTPAEDMLRVDALARPARLPDRIGLSGFLVRSVAARAGIPVPRVSDTLVRMKIPVSVSGLLPGRAGHVRKFLRQHDASFKLTAGTSASSLLAATVDSLAPGGNFAAALSYGDVTVAGIGTTSYVCGGKALAFGHPLLLTGHSELGAGSADAITIVPDPFGPYKLANVTEALGTLDQDRLAGVRGVDGVPATTPVETTVTSLDTAAWRSGETDVVLPEAVPDFAFSHVVGNIDSVFDAIGPGSSYFSWTVRGTREDGSPWVYRRSNDYVSPFDISFESTFELYGQLAQIQFYPFEDVEITSIEADVDVEETVRTYQLVKVLICHQGTCVPAKRLFSRPGKTLKLRAVLRPSDASGRRLVKLELTIPRSANAGALVEVAGRPRCLVCGSRRPSTFGQLLRSLRRASQNNMLGAQLHTGLTGRVRDHDQTLLDHVVRGAVRIPVFFPGECCPPSLGGGGNGDVTVTVAIPASG